MEGSSSVGMESMASHMIELLQRSEPPGPPPLSSECCIYRVPNNIRDLNEEVYTPHVISVGPFHHGDKRLETMQMIKVRFFKIFVEQSNLNVEDLLRIIQRREEDVRRCYAEISNLSSCDYVKMILLDASFIIVYFLKFQSIEWHDSSLIPFTESLKSVVKDMWLLENQLPFFVIEELYNFAFASCLNYPSFMQLTLQFFSYYITQKMCLDPDLKVMHFVDLLRSLFLPPSHRLLERPRVKNVMHLNNVSQLDEVEVKFTVGLSNCLLDLHFKNGVLEIPCLFINRTTESVFRNLLALEQCHYLFDAYFTDYIRILDFLIDTPKDVDLLVKNRVLVNYLQDSNAVATLVNNLGTHISQLNINSNYYNLCKDLNAFYKHRPWKPIWHRWKTILQRDYFSNPWRSASTVAAIILLVLTFIQTVRSFY